MATKKDKIVNTEDDVSIENKDTISEEPTEKESKTMLPMIMALIVAIPTGMIVAYVAMPDQADEVFSSLSETNNEVYKLPNVQPRMAAHANVRSRNQYQAPEWVAHQREQMEKRRADFDRQNADRTEANRNSPEPPQWVKDQQALMQKEQAKYQQEWEKRSVQMANNRNQPQSGYMNNSAMNMHPLNQVPAYGYAQNPAQYYNGYAQPVNPYQYNNGPYTAPQQAPYLQNGYPYR